MFFNSLDSNILKEHTFCAKPYSSLGSLVETGYKSVRKANASLESFESTLDPNQELIFGDLLER